MACFITKKCAVEDLISIRSGLKDPNGALSNWDEDSVDPCSWSMITCSPDNTVTALSVFPFFFMLLLYICIVYAFFVCIHITCQHVKFCFEVEKLI